MNDEQYSEFKRTITMTAREGLAHLKRDGVSRYSPSRELLDAIPALTVETIARWVFHAYAPGSFMTAVLENNLRLAVACADLENRSALYEIVSLISHHTPVGCWGSPSIVEGWRRQHEQIVLDERYEWMREHI